MYRHELKATVPREILECSAVSREINFTSKQEIRQFRLEQRVFLAGACIEGASSAVEPSASMRFRVATLYPVHANRRDHSSLGRMLRELATHHNESRSSIAVQVFFE